MNNKETAALVEAMHTAFRCESRAPYNITDARNGLKAALAVAQKAMRDSVLEEAAQKLDARELSYADKDGNDMQKLANRLTCAVVRCSATEIRAMKTNPEGGQDERD